MKKSLFKNLKRNVAKHIFLNFYFVSGKDSVGYKKLEYLNLKLLQHHVANYLFVYKILESNLMYYGKCFFF